MSFSDSVRRNVDRSKDDFAKVRRRAVTLLGEEMAKTKPEGGRVPVDTGNLARSLLASKEGMPKASDAPSYGSNVGAVAATLQPHEPVWIGYQAVYARRQNYGFVGADSLGRVYNQQGNYFVEHAISMWPEIVRQAVKEVSGK